MSDEIFNRILKDMIDLKGLDLVIFYLGAGDATLDTKLKARVSQMRSQFPTVCLSLLTNGLLLTQEFLDGLEVDYICLSVLGGKFPPLSYEENTGVTWTQIVEVANYIAQSSSKLNINLMLDSTEFLEEIVSDFKLLRESEIQINRLCGNTVSEVPAENFIDDVYKMYNKHQQENYIRIYLNNIGEWYNSVLRTKYYKKDFYRNPIVTEFCNFPTTSLNVTCKGDVLYCSCLDYTMSYSVGNIIFVESLR
jgi:MoaA/NifB/PqqE/SkfB family radical SAM enzyme